MSIPWSFQVMLLLLILIAAAFDLVSRRIPNWLVATGILWGIVLNVILFSWPGLMAAVFGIGLAFLVYFPLFAVRGMGAGDVKLMMAVGAIVGPTNWLLLFVLTSALGGVFGVVLIVRRRCVRQTLRRVCLILTELVRFHRPYARDGALQIDSAEAVTMPHAVTIAIASVLFLTVRHFGA